MLLAVVPPPTVAAGELSTEFDTPDMVIAVSPRTDRQSGDIGSSSPIDSVIRYRQPFVLASGASPLVFGNKLFREQ
jgi:hypothetical protein